MIGDSAACNPRDECGKFTNLHTPPNANAHNHLPPHSSPSDACTKVVTLLMCWLFAVTFMLAEPALALGCDVSSCYHKPLYECDLAKCTGKL